MTQRLLKKVKSCDAGIAVMGLGYVGLPLAVEFGRVGFRVVGIDPDAGKIQSINAGQSYITDVKSGEVASLVKQGRLEATSDFSVLKNADFIFICVPTPFSKFKTPDLSYIIDASEQIVKSLREGQVIILESTTFPGTTEEIVQPILERNGLKAGRDFHLVFSPERVDPGNRNYDIRNTPKVIGGYTPECTKLAAALYQRVIEKNHVVTVSTPKIAEMTKLLENIFRSVNIALINELTLLCDKMDIDIWEVIEAAKSKPFGFMPFYPGPGVGGHCIPVDPYYLSWKAREYDFYTRFIELSAEVNLRMPDYVIAKIIQALNSVGKPLKGSKALLLGVAFKKDINDARNSPALKIIDTLLERGAEVFYNDPFIPELGNGHCEYFDKEMDLGPLKSSKLTKALLKRMDCVAVIVDHSEYDPEMIVQNSRLVVDSRNITKGIDGGGKLFKL